MTLKNLYKLIILAAIFAAFAACTPKDLSYPVSSSVSYSADESVPLNTWLDKIAGPKLSHLMGEHPMFKNQPFLIASLSGEEIKPVKNKLTRSIRERLHHHLLNKPGVNLVWRPETNWEDLSDPGNKQLEKIRYYIGISNEISTGTSGSLLKIGIKILNVDEKKWVPALHLYWQGPPTAVQKRTFEQDSKIDTSKFNIVDKSLLKKISIIKIKSKNNQNGFMEVQLTGRNTTSSYIPLEYQLKWFDENGIEIRTILSRWIKTPAYANSEFGFKSVAPGTMAKDYRIFIRKGGN